MFTFPIGFNYLVNTPPTSGDTPNNTFGASLVGWWKATNVTVVSGRVSQWDDLSGNNNHATQTDINSRPFYETTGFNGFPTIDFQNNYWFDLPDFLNNSWGEATLFAVYDLVDTNSHWVVCQFGSYGIDHYWGTNSSFSFSSYFGEFRTSRLEGIPSSGLSVTGKAITEVISGNSTYKINRNGIELLNTTPSWGVTNVPLIGKTDGVGTLKYMNGKISELILINREANSGEILTTREYLRNSWNVY